MNLSDDEKKKIADIIAEAMDTPSMSIALLEDERTSIFRAFWLEVFDWAGEKKWEWGRNEHGTVWIWNQGLEVEANEDGFFWDFLSCVAAQTIEARKKQ